MKFRSAIALRALTRPLAWYRVAPAVCAALIAGIGPIRADTDTWNGSINALWDTNGNWTLGLGGNATPTATDDVIFGITHPSGLTITLGAGEVANSLAFSDHYVLTSGALTLTLGNVSVAPASNVIVDSVLGGSAGLSVSGGGTLSIPGRNIFTGTTTVGSGTLRVWHDANLGAAANSIGLNGGTLQAGSFYTRRALSLSSAGTIDVARNFNAQVASPITGSGTLTKTGDGELRILNDNPGFTGALEVTRGTVRVQSTTAGGLTNNYAGALTAASGFTLRPGGVLSADNSLSTSTAPTVNLLSDTAPIFLRGGRLSFAGNNAGIGTAFTETAGDLVLDESFSTITATRTNANSAAVLALGTLTQNPGASVTFNNSGGTLGATGNNPRITFRTAPSLNDGMIGGWALVTAGSATDFAGYFGVGGTGDQGVGALGTAGFPGYATHTGATVGSAAATDNVLITAGDGTIATIGNLTINSLKLVATASTPALSQIPGTTLTIDSGGIISQNAAFFTTLGSQGANLTASGSALCFHTAGSAPMTVNSTIIGAGVAVAKDVDNALLLDAGADSTFGGGTFVTGGTLTTGSVAGRSYLGTGAVNVSSATLQLAQSGATTSASGITVSNQGQVVLSSSTAEYTTTGDRFAIQRGSAISGPTPAAANQGLNSLTRVTSVQAGGEVVLGPDAIIAHSGLSAPLDLATGTIKNLGNDADLFYGVGATQGDALGSILIGRNTPFKGLSTDRNSRTWSLGTVNVASETRDIFLQGMVFPGSTAFPVTTAILSLGNGPTAGGVSITPSGSTALFAHVIGGTVSLNDDSSVFGSAAAPMTFVVEPGAFLEASRNNALGSGTGLANAIVRNGGTLRQAIPAGNLAEAGFNAPVRLEAGGRFLAQNAAGLSGTGVITFEPGSILQISNATGWSGAQAEATLVPATAVVRLNASNFGTSAQPLLTRPSFSGAGIFEVFGGNLGAANPTFAGTSILNLNGGIVTNDHGDRTWNAASNGVINIGAAGGTIASSTGFSFTMNNALSFGGNSLTVGSIDSIDGAAKMGEIRLAGPVTALPGAQITVIPNVALRIGSANVLDDDLVLNLGAGSQLNVDNADALTRITSTPTSTIVGDSALTLLGSGNNILNAQLGGSVSLTQRATGTLTLAQSTALSGFATLRVERGTLQLGPGVNIGTGYAINVTAAAGATATFDFQNTSNTVGALLLAGTDAASAPVIAGNGGTVRLTGGITYDAFNSPLAGVVSVSTLDLNGANRTVAVGDGPAVIDLVIGSGIQGGAGSGITKTGTGVLKLSGTSNTGVTTTNVTSGTLIFDGVSAIPGAGSATITVTGLAAVALAGSVNPLADFGDRIVPSSTGAVVLDTSSKANLDFTGFSSLRLRGFNSGNTATNFSGTITPDSGIYRLGGQAPLAGVNAPTTTFVLSGSNALRGANSLDLAPGNLTIVNQNSYTGGTNLNNSVLVGMNVVGIGSDAALGAGTVTLGGDSLVAFGAVNGDHVVQNRIVDSRTGSSSFVAGGDQEFYGIGNNNKLGTLAYAGTLDLGARAATTRLSSGNSHPVMFLGDITNTTNGITLEGGGIFSLLATPANGGVAKSYSGPTSVSAVEGLIIDSPASLGGSTSVSLGFPLQVQPGTTSVTLPPSVGLSVGSSTFFIPGGSAGVVASTLTIQGVISSQSSPDTYKTGMGTLVLQNSFSSGGSAGGLSIVGGKVQLDYGNLIGAGPILPNGSSLRLGSHSNPNGQGSGLTNGTTLEILGSSTAPVAQTFGSVELTSRENTISLINPAGQSLSVTFTGGFNPNIAAGAGSTLNFKVQGLTPPTIASTATGPGGILYGNITFTDVTAGTIDFAAANGTQIGRFTGYTSGLPASGSSSSINYLETAATASVTVTESINSLKLLPTTTQTITLNSGVVLTNNAWGLLYDNTNASSTIIGPGQIVCPFSNLYVMTGGASSTNKLTLSGVLKAASMSVVKGGPGTLVLAGVNTYGGPLTINNGVVEYSDGSAVGANLGSAPASSPGIRLSGGTLRYTGAANNDLIFRTAVAGLSAFDIPIATGAVTHTAPMSGTRGLPGALRKTGAGTLTLSGADTNSGLSVQVVAGTLNMAKSSSATVFAVDESDAGAALIVENGAAARLTANAGAGNQISDTSSVVVKTGGIFDVMGPGATITTETFDGLAGGGTIQNTVSSPFTLTLGANNSANLSRFTPAAAAAGVNATGLNHFSGVIQGNIALTKVGGGIQILAGNNTYLGDTYIIAGPLKLAIANALPSGSGKGNVNIAGNNFGSTLVGAAPGTIPAPGMLDMGGFDQAINGLNSTTGGFVTNTPASAANTSNILHVGNNNASSSFDGVIADGYSVAADSSTAAPSFFTGAVHLHKVGTGTLTLLGANTFSGTTIVDEGTLIVGDGVSGSLNGVVMVNSGTLGGFGSTAGNVTIGNGAGGSDAFIAPGYSPGTFTTTLSLSLLSDASYQFELNSTTAQADKIVANGVSLDSSALFSFTDLGSGTFVTDGSVAFLVIDNTSASPISGQFGNLPVGVAFTINGNVYLPSYTGGTGNDLTFTVVPEPGTLSSLLTGLAPLLSLSRFRRRRAA